MITTQVEEITPQLAREMLENATVNRPVRARWVTNIARAISDGGWMLNGETIVLSASGALLDGQHRLTAVIEAGVPIRTLVTRGVDQSTFASLDSGVSRKFSDVLSIRAENGSIPLAKATNWLWKYQNGDIMHETTRASNSELEATLESHPGLRASLDYVNSLEQLKKLLSPALATFCHYVCSLEDRKRADDFFARVSDGVGLAVDSPIYALRERLITAHGRRGRQWGFLRARDKIALTIKAWNNFRTGSNVIRLRWGRNEKFPRAA